LTKGYFDSKLTIVSTCLSIALYTIKYLNEGYVKFKIRTRQSPQHSSSPCYFSELVCCSHMENACRTPSFQGPGGSMS